MPGMSRAGGGGAVRLPRLLGEPHSSSLCAIAMGEAIAKVTELEVTGHSSEQVTTQCSCRCMRCRHGLCDRFGMNLDQERLKIRARMRGRWRDASHAGQ